jgi:NAD(P)-dependent dehydrogenase (short-subunit alcohol dehydrogenase family)
MAAAGFLNGKISVITGASRGIGAALAVQMGGAGAQCILIARTVGGLEATDDAIRQAGGPPAALVPLDLINDIDKVDALGAELFQRYGRVDYLIGNAAQLGGLSPLNHFVPKTWHETLALNATANYRLIRSFDMLLHQSKAGRALFMTCAAARQPEAFWGAYSASKAALEAMVASYAIEVNNTTVRAACFDPGIAATKLYRTAFPGIPDDALPTPAAAARKIMTYLEGWAQS